MTACALAVALAVCPLTAQEPAVGEAGGEPLRYRVLADESLILIRVFRAGALSRLGHNHVIAVREMEGSVRVEATGGATFTLHLPVAALEVDDPGLRRQAGDAFASEPSAADIEGTRRNMLGPRLLQAEDYPLITITGTTVASTGFQAATVRFEVKQHRLEKTVPIDARVTAQSIAVTGQLALTHEELGLTPFRAALGALRVADVLEMSFEIQATREN